MPLYMMVSNKGVIKSPRIGHACQLLLDIWVFLFLSTSTNANILYNKLDFPNPVTPPIFDTVALPYASIVDIDNVVLAVAGTWSR